MALEPEQNNFFYSIHHTKNRCRKGSHKKLIHHTKIDPRKLTHSVMLEVAGAPRKINPVIWLTTKVCS
jgi:hypothetical protein